MLSDPGAVTRPGPSEETMDDTCCRLLSECIQGADEVWDQWQKITKRKGIRLDVWTAAVRLRVDLYQVAKDLQSIQERYA